MKTDPTLLSRLQQLNATDRGWVMQQLSEVERAQLLATLEAAEQPVEVVSMNVREVRPVAPSDNRKNEGAKSLSRVEPRIMAALLRHEPAWIAALVLQSQDASWSRELLDAMPALQRSEVERIRSQTFGAELVQAVTKQVLARCQGDVAAVSAFDRLVERIGASRSKRRLTLHL